MARGMLSKVDLLGLDQFANPSSELFGMAVGAAATSLVKQMSSPDKAGKWGFVAGAASSAILFWRGKKSAGMGAIAGTLISSGLLDVVIGKVLSVFGMGNGLSGGMGLPQIVDLGPGVHGSFGLPDVNSLAPVYGAGMGLPGIGPVPTAYGVWNAESAPSGVAGPQLGQHPPVDLLGRPSAQAQQLELMGGPVISGLSSHYGATLLGGLNQ